MRGRVMGSCTDRKPEELRELMSNDRFRSCHRRLRTHALMIWRGLSRSEVADNERHGRQQH